MQESVRQKKFQPHLSIDELRHLIERKAYAIYVERGGWHGNDWGDWFAAEKDVVNLIAQKRKSF